MIGLWSCDLQHPIGVLHFPVEYLLCTKRIGLFPFPQWPALWSNDYFGRWQLPFGQKTKKQIKNIPESVETFFKFSHVKIVVLDGHFHFRRGPDVRRTKLPRDLAGERPGWFGPTLKSKRLGQWLVEQSFLTPEVRGSNPVIAKLFILPL